MKLSALIGERFRETPSDCIIESHTLMLRGGYIKYVAGGIYSALPPLKRITDKIERIIREEMDALGGQEVLLPVALPASLWEESGRLRSVGGELLRFEDRNGSALVLGMTHEEAAVHLVREYASGHSRYPFMIYQIQTKFRDEKRPRAGLIRVREFTMKDAYSFHTSQEDLDDFYRRCMHAYERIFTRVGIPQTVCVASDAGMMGGNVSHEFMLLTPAGEDSIVVCPSCGYLANMETAECILPEGDVRAPGPLTPVHTPDISTMEELCAFLKAKPQEICKAVVYRKDRDQSCVIVFLRGDLEVNETRLTRLLGEEVHPARLTEEDGLQAGFIGPCGLNPDASSRKITVLWDRSLQGGVNLICGANQKDTHYTGLCIERDCPGIKWQELAKAVQDGICPACRKKGILISRGIEVGNIFQLGARYTHAMHMQYTDESGALREPLMGCYGIGIGRLAASVCEASHDGHGPIWPVSIAPWQVHLCCLRSDDEQVHAQAEELYISLQREGLEVLYDDRPVSAGAMFSDADLLGVPVRLTVSPRNFRDGCVEISLRGDSFRHEVIPAARALPRIRELLRELSAALEPV